MTACSDNDLIARLRKGDEDAFNTLFWKHHSPVYHNVLRIVGDESAAEDIIQEVFLSLWQHRKKINEGGDVKAWLFRVSYNKSIDSLKASQKRELLRQELSHLNIPEESYQQLEQRHLILEKAIAQLPPQKKRVFDRCRLNSKSYQDAAREMNISKNTVKEYLTDAMRSVKSFVHLFIREGLTSILFLLSGHL